MTLIRRLLDCVLDGYDPALAQYRDRMAHRYIFREFDQAKSTAAVERLRRLERSTPRVKGGQ